MLSVCRVSAPRAPPSHAHAHASHAPHTHTAEGVGVGDVDGHGVGRRTLKRGYGEGCEGGTWRDRDCFWEGCDERERKEREMMMNDEY